MTAPSDLETGAATLLPRRRVLQLAGGAGLAWPWAALAQPQTTPPLEDFFQRPAFSGARLSPSGKRVALRVGARKQRDRLAVLDLSTMKLQLVAAFEIADVRRFAWVNDHRLVYDLADRQSANADQVYAPGLYAVNADGTGYRQLVLREWAAERFDRHLRQLPWNTFLLSQVGAQDSDSVYVVQPEALSSKGLDYFKLLRLNTVTGLSDEIETPLNAFAWLIDAQGELRAVFTAREGRAAIHWKAPAADSTPASWRRLREFDRFGLGSDFRMQAVAPDGRLHVSARGGADTESLYLYDPAKDVLDAQPLLVTPGYDLDPEIVTRRGQVLGVRHHVDAELTQWFDESMKRHQAEVDRLLPATTNRLQPASQDEGPWLLVTAFSDVQPALFLLFHTGTRKLTRLGAEQPGINPAQMSPMDMVRYKARDGLEIPAYLTLPAGAASPKKLPLVVLVHGGPWVRGAYWQWQPEVQFLASRGYAVLQPEFRGSTGFGLKHFTAGWKQWGRAMQDDLADGARWAVAQGHADPARIAIMGASYGGYAAMMGLVKDPELFRCGVAWAGVSDLLLLFDARWSDASDAFKKYGMPRLIGDREQDAAVLTAHSPLQQAARIRNPLLLGHGRVDRRVPIEHGRRLRDAVQPHNAALEWVEYEKEGHGWALPETDVDWWGRVERFLARHLGAKA